MPHICVQRLGSRDGEDNRTEQNECDSSMSKEEIQPIPGVGRRKNFRSLQNLSQSQQSDRREPDDHHRTEYSAHLCGAMLLKEEQTGEDDDSQRKDEVL